MAKRQAIAFVDSEQFRGIEEYFKLVPFVYLAPLCPNLFIRKIVRVEPMTFANLVTEMSVELEAGDSAVIYTHGSPKELRFPVGFSTAKNYIDTDEFNFLANHLHGLETKTQHNLNPSYLKMNAEVGAIMMSDLMAIRKKRMPHLAIQACNVGKNPDLLHAARRAFGASICTGPRYQLAFGRLQLGLYPNQDEFTKLANKVHHGVGGVHLYGQQPGRRVTFHRTLGPKSTVSITHQSAWAESPFATADFMRDIVGYTLPSSGYQQIMPYFHIHAVETKMKMIFPLEHEYHTHFTMMTA